MENKYVWGMGLPVKAVMAGVRHKSQHKILHKNRNIDLISMDIGLLIKC